MGSSFLCASLGFRAPGGTLDPSAAEQVLLDAAYRCGQLSDEQIRRHDEFLQGGYEGDVAAYRRQLAADLDELNWAVLQGNHREATWIQGGPDLLLLVSGGGSDGEPGALYGAIDRLRRAGVIEDARWPGAFEADLVAPPNDPPLSPKAVGAPANPAVVECGTPDPPPLADET